MDIIRKIIREALEQLDGLVPIKTNKYVYHSSNPKFRAEIEKQGLVPKGKSETWLSDTNIDGEVIFATNSDNKDDWFDSTYDDDIYRINTSQLNNEWFNDPNFDNKDERFLEYNGKRIKLPKTDEKYFHVITFEPIPLNAIELIYKGSGESKF